MSTQAKSMSESVVATPSPRTELSMPESIIIVVGLATCAVLGFGGNFLPSGPIASFGYILLTVAIVGWIITVLRATPSSQR
jgi:hypothetical protein